MIKLAKQKHKKLIKNKLKIVEKRKDINEYTSDESDSFYEVEKIVRKRKHGKYCEYLVHWKGFPSDEDTWEPEHSLTNCTELIKEFENKKTKEIKKMEKKPKKEKTQPNQNSEKGLDFLPNDIDENLVKIISFPYLLNGIEYYVVEYDSKFFLLQSKTERLINARINYLEQMIIFK